jgi:hypothetical protein
VTERELVASYIDGQIGRRAFIRRLVQSGVSLSAALAYANVLGASPAAASLGDPSDLYEEDQLIRVSFQGINPEIARVLRGGLVQWNFRDGPHAFADRRYTVTDPLDFIDLDDNQLNSGKRADRFFSAGTFRYTVFAQRRDESDENYGPAVEHQAKIESLMRVSRARVQRGNKVTVSWASRPAPNNCSYDVQIKRPNENSFSFWKDQVTKPNAVFRPGQEGTFRFRARLHRLSDDETSGWSPARSLRSV